MSTEKEEADNAGGSNWHWWVLGIVAAILVISFPRATIGILVCVFVVGLLSDSAERSRKKKGQSPMEPAISGDTEILEPEEDEASADIWMDVLERGVEIGGKGQKAVAKGLRAMIGAPSQRSKYPED